MALSLAPLIRIVSLAMPLEEFSSIYSYLIISIPLFIAVLAAIRILNLQPAAIGLTMKRLPVQLLVAVTGVGFGLAEYYILKPEPLIDILTWQEALGPALILRQLRKLAKGQE